MHVEGTIARWNDDKGYGFIAPKANGKDVFVHITDIIEASRRPTEGAIVSFKLRIDASGRACATHVSLLNKQADGHSNGRSSAREMAVSIVYLAILSLLSLYTSGPVWIPVWSLLMSVLAYHLYAKDKAAAISGSQRIAENTLHIVSLLGGWPGALIARKKVRHKTIKQPFRTLFWLTVVLNISATAWLFNPPGSEFSSKISPLFSRAFWHETNCEWLSERVVECR